MDLLVEKVGGCVVITMDLGENRMNPNFVRAMNKALDEAESYEDAKCLVTMGVGKHYSLGLDLQWMAGQPSSEVKQFFDSFQRLLARLLTFPLVTVAALNGHAYAGGAFMAICHDRAIMRKDKGWFCFPEINIKMTIPTSLINLAKSRLPYMEQHRAIVLGTRYTAEQALSAKVVQEVCPAEELKVKAIATGHRLAGKNGLDREVLSAMKRDLYSETHKGLVEPAQFHSKI